MSASEIQIQIESSSRCSGSCAGCSVPQTARRGAEDMPDILFSQVGRRVAEFLQALPQVHRVHVTLGPGDHLQMPAPQLSGRLGRMQTILQAASISEPRVLFSTALIGKPGRVVEALSVQAEACQTGGVPVSPLIVMDPEKMAHPVLRDNFIQALQAAHTLFGGYDLAITLSGSACLGVRVDDIIEILKSLPPPGGVSLNWRPQTGESPWPVFRWVSQFLEAADGTALAPALLSVLRGAAGLVSDGPAREALQQYLQRNVHKTVFVDRRGGIYPYFEAIGDIPQNELVGFSELGNVYHDTILDTLIKQRPRIVARILHGHSQAACQNCSHLHKCVLTGFHLYNRLLKPGHSGCPHAADELFAKFAAETSSAVI